MASRKSRLSEARPPGDPRNREVRTVAISGLLGTTIEYYDFLLYSAMAALVFGSLYFPSHDPAASTIAAFGALAAGYVARPLGGMIFGHFGDRLGRKATLVTSMVLMGLASVLIGLLPDYDAIGVTAPILLILLRLVQGIAVGGEYGGAALMVVEHADAGRRGAWVGIMQMGSPLGALLSTGALTVVTFLPEEQFLSWGWRIPFLASALLLLVGLYIRLSVSESPLFKQAAEAAKQRKAESPPLIRLLRRPRTLLLASAAGIGPFALTALISSHSLAYGRQIGYETSDLLRTQLVLNALALVAIPFFSALSDRVGRRRIVAGGAAGAIVFAFPMYMLVDTVHVPWLVLALAVGILFQNMMYAPLASLLSELFGTRVRYTGISMGYQMASLIGAGFTPLVAASLVAGNGGSSIPLSLIMAGTAAVSLVAITLVAETRGRDLLEEDLAGPPIEAVPVLRSSTIEER